MGSPSEQTVLAFPSLSALFLFFSGALDQLIDLGGEIGPIGDRGLHGWSGHSGAVRNMRKHLIGFEVRLCLACRANGADHLPDVRTIDESSPPTRWPIAKHDLRVFLAAERFVHKPIAGRRDGCTWMRRDVGVQAAQNGWIEADR